MCIGIHLPVGVKTVMAVVRVLVPVLGALRCRRQLDKWRRSRKFAVLLAHDETGSLVGCATLSLLRCEAAWPPPLPTSKPFRCGAPRAAPLPLALPPPPPLGATHPQHSISSRSSHKASQTVTTLATLASLLAPVNP